MDAQSFLTALGPAMTDAAERERLLTDPRAVLAAAGLDLPDWFTVTAVEGDTPALTLTLPSMLKPDADLTEEQLAAVSGGMWGEWDGAVCWRGGLRC